MIETLFYIENTAGQIILFLIIALILVAIFNIIRNVLRYNGPEQAALRSVIERSQQIDSSLDLPTIKSKLLSDIDVGTLTNKRVDMIYNIAIKNHDVEQEQLTSLLVSGEQNKFGVLLISYISRTLLLFGLLGTFIGLVVMSSKFDVLLSSLQNTPLAEIEGAISEITDNMGVAIQGLAVAFKTTLWGLVGTIIVAIGSLFLDYSQQKFIGKMEQLTTEKLIPIFTPPEFSKSIEEAGRGLKESAEKIKVSLEHIRASAEKTYDTSKTLDGVLQKFVAGATLFDGGAKMINDSQMKIHHVLGELGAKVDAAEEKEKSLFERMNQTLLLQDDNTKLLSELLEEIRKGESLSEELVNSCLTSIAEQQGTYLEKLDEALRDKTKMLELTIVQQREIYDTLAKHISDNGSDLIKRVDEKNKTLYDQVTSNEEMTGQKLLGINTLLQEQAEILRQFKESVTEKIGSRQVIVENPKEDVGAIENNQTKKQGFFKQMFGSFLRNTL